MKINIVSVGSIKEKYLKDAINEYAKRLTKFTKIDFFSVSDEQIPDNVSLNVIEQIKHKEGEKILKVIPDLTKWANEIMAYATESAVNHGKQWNGFKVVEGRSVRKYTDEDAVAKAAKEAGYKDIYRQSLITLTEMQRLMGKATFEKVLGDLIYKPPGKPTLIPNSDKREAMNISDAKNEFKMED